MRIIIYLLELNLGGGSTASDSWFLGNIDDVRIYATALSANDIKELYEVKGSIDNNGNILSNSFIENNQNIDTTNLIYNGCLELGSLDGFQSDEVNNNKDGLTYISDDCFNGSNGCIEIAKGRTCVCRRDVLKKSLIPIYQGDSYKLEFDIKFMDTLSNYYYSAFFPCDIAKNRIAIDSTNKKANTSTTLANAINNGDTTIQLNGTGENWNNGTAQYAKQIGICDYPHYPNWERCRIRANYNNIDGNTITLVDAWNQGTIPAGTKVANFASGSVQYYPNSWGAAFSKIGEWVHYESTVVLSNIRPTTAYTYFGFIWNAPCITRITNIKLTNISRLQTINDFTDFKNQNIDKNYIINGSDFIEIGMPIRYIRDWCKGSTTNEYSHWVEIKAFNSTEQNVALGKKATRGAGTTNTPIITDGNIDTGRYVGGENYVTVDLGFIEKIDKVQVWHYYGDGRTYYDTKTEVSSDGINWYTIFDSAIEGTYAETFEGHTIYIYPQRCTVNKTGEIYSNEIIEI